MYNFDTKLALRTNYGAVDLNAVMRNGNSKTTASYTADIKANNLNIGALTKQPETVGNISLTAHVKGLGLDPKKRACNLAATW